MHLKNLVYLVHVDSTNSPPSPLVDLRGLFMNPPPPLRSTWFKDDPLFDKKIIRKMLIIIPKPKTAKLHFFEFIFSIMVLTSIRL